MKISDFTKEQLQFFLDNEEKIKEELQPKKYNIGDCFIVFDYYHELSIFKITGNYTTNNYEHRYECTHRYSSFRDDFGIDKRYLDDKDLDSYIKIDSSLYDSIESSMLKYNQRRDDDYKQLNDKYRKEITDYIENLKPNFKK